MLCITPDFVDMQLLSPVNIFQISP